jgi:hypothetical protein
MTNISRGLAALTIFAVAGFTAGCASADAPTKTAAAPAKKTAAPAKKVGPAKTAYCVPLAKAIKATPPFDKLTDESMKKYGRLLEPAAALASAGGTTDVGTFLSRYAKENLHPGEFFSDESAAGHDRMRKVNAIILKDCGVNMFSMI